MSAESPFASSRSVPVSRETAFLSNCAGAPWLRSVFGRVEADRQKRGEVNDVLMVRNSQAKCSRPSERRIRPDLVVAGSCVVLSDGWLRVTAQAVVTLIPVGFADRYGGRDPSRAKSAALPKKYC